MSSGSYLPQEAEWSSLAQTAANDAGGGEGVAAAGLQGALCAELQGPMERRMIHILSHGSQQLAFPMDANPDAIEQFVKEAVRAFFSQDLLQASLALLRGAEGSFGLVLSHSLDAERETIVAARGQTMR